MKWFKLEEFRCRCCGGLLPLAKENIEALVENVLDPARQRYGGPVLVNSGYRCLAHNKAVGGVPNSQHLVGQAADIRCEDNKKLGKIIELGVFDQLIYYPTFIHVSYKKTGVNRKQIIYKK